MKITKQLMRIIALMLTLAVVLTACQVPEGLEIPSGVSVPSDLSDLTSQELEQLESILEEEDISLDADALEEEVVFGDGTQSGGTSDAEHATDITDTEGADTTAGAKESTDADAVTDTTKDATVKGTVELVSGRDWVHKILNVEEYVKAYPDLQAAYGENWDGYVDHYLTYGLYEGRDEGKLFDPWEYAEAYPDVKEAFGNDVNAIIAHYVNHGINEGKTAGTAAGYVDMADKVSREYMMSHDVVVREPGTRMEALVTHAETILKYARNIEGANQPQLFVDGLNVDNYEPTKWNRNLVKEEPVASDIYSQFNLLKMMDTLSVMTGDPKYSEAALDQIRIRFNTPGLTDANGLFWEGGHSFLNVMTGQKYGLNYHETKDYQLPLELMYKADPEGTKRYITAFWNAHVLDWSNLLMNRHGYFDTPMTDTWDSEYNDPCPWVSGKDVSPFMSTGNDLMDMAWFMTEVTGDPKYAEWGELMLDKYIAIGNPETGLVGEQYGMMTDDSIYGVDRFLASAMGADFVTRTGFDFKTATMDDYKLFGANSLITRTSLKCNTAYGPMNFAKIYRNTGNEKIYNFVVNNMLSWEEYVYDQELHRYNTPILNDGTDLNEGEDGKQLIATKTGYYMTQGKPLAEYEGIWGGVFPALIETISILKPEDTEAYERLWTAARAYARNVGLGDIGTRMGENIKMSPETGECAVQYVQAVVLMYKYTGAQEYLDAACTMADRLVKSRFDPELGMFVVGKNYPYAPVGSDAMYAVYLAEAAAQGLINDIDIEISQGVHDIPYEGKGQVMSQTLWWGTGKVAVKSVKFDRDAYTIVVHNDPQVNFSDLATAAEPSAIKQMASIGVLGAEADGLFHPEQVVTRGEMVDMVNSLFGFTEASQIEYAFADVDIDAAYAHYEVTRAEMASIITRALEVKLPDKTWQTGDATYRLTDAATIPAWAKEYADIVTNYRLMVDLEDETFEPNAVVTKDMAAGIFQEVARYIDIPTVKAVLPEIMPLNPDNDKMIWESTDTSIVEVDEQGRLYPVSTGTAIVRVTVDEKFADLEVTVSVQDDWMVKEVFIDGESFYEFNSNELEYYINLDKGTHTVPTITATSFTGEEVIVNLPVSLPGTAQFYVKGYEDMKYTLEIDNEYIDYIIDENFNHKTGTKIENVVTDRFSWNLAGLSINYRDSWKVVPKNWVRPDYEGYGVMAFPYKHIKNVPGDCYLKLAQADRQLTGEQADDMLMVFEMDLAVKNIQGKENGFQIWIMENYGKTYHAAAHFLINEDGLAREISSTTVDRPTKRQMIDGEFINLRVVIDKKNRTFDYFYNGDLLQKDIAFFHGDNVPNISAMYIGVLQEEIESNAELFMDNLKVYQITHAAYEEMMPQEELPPPTPKPEWLTHPISLDFDKFRENATMHQTAEEPFTAHIGEGVYYGNVKVKHKTDVVPMAAADDMCLNIYGGNCIDWNGTFRYRLDKTVRQELGADAENKNLVVEMDVAVGGADSKENGYRIGLYQNLGSSYMSTAVLHISDTEISRVIDSRYNTVDPTLRTSINKGEFNHIKIVVNKQTKRVTYYVNGEVVESNVAPLYPETPNFEYILFEVVKENNKGDYRLYVDNLNVYVEEVAAQPTARPTHVPIPTATPAPTNTPHPFPINEDYDGYAVGTYFNARTSTEYYNSTISESAYVREAKVVAKSDIIPTAAADDLCMEFAFNTLYDMNARMALKVDRKFKLGEGYLGDRYIVTEMDVAIAGTDNKPGGYDIWLDESLSTGYRSVARFKLTDGGLYRYTDSTNKISVASYTKGEFAHLIVIVDKLTKKWSYAWNGILIESNLNAMWGDVPHFANVHFTMIKEATTDIDSRFYADNIKVYETADIPAIPTPGPTATPRPDATPAPTKDPYVARITFDEFADGTHARNLSGTTWSGTLDCGGYLKYGKVVPKTTIDATASATDKVFEFTPVTNINVATNSDTTVRDLNFRLTLNAGYRYTLGSEVTEDRYVVVDMDMAIMGDDAKARGFGVYMSPGSNYSIAQFRLFNDKIGRVHTGSTGAYSVTAPYTSGEFGHLTFVLDRQTRQFGYFWNGQLIESSVGTLYSDGALQFSQIHFFIYSESGLSEDIDTKFYVDNIMISAVDENPMENVPVATAAPTQAPVATPAPTSVPTAVPTAEPTPVPTENPIVADIVFDNFELGHAYIRSLSGDFWTGGLDCGGWIANGKVVSKKDTIDPGAAEGDYCYEFKPDVAQTLNFRFRLNNDRKYSIGSAVDTEKYVVVEMDMGIKGEDAKASGYGIFMGPRSGDLSTAELRLFDDRLARIHTGSTGGSTRKADYTSGNLVHLKWVLDREKKTYSYFLDGELVESNVADLYNLATDFGQIHIRVYAEAPAEGEETLDSRFYVDNIKIYATDN